MKQTSHLTLETIDPPGLRFRARADHQDLEFLLDSGPEAVGPTPVDVVIAALGACAAMDVITILRKKRLAVTGYEVELTAQRRDDHPKAITAIESVHRLRGRGLPREAVAEALHLSETRYCSIQSTLAPGVALSSRVEIEEEAPAAP